MSKELTNVAQELQNKKMEMNYQLEIAAQFIKSGAFPNVKSPEQAFVIVKAGEEMGLKPIEAMNSLYIVNGNIKPWGMGGLTRPLSRAGYRMNWQLNGLESVVLTVTHPNEPQLKIVEKAHKNELTRSSAYKFAPENKLRFHALGKVASFHLAHLYSGYSDFGAVDVMEIEGEPQDETTMESITASFKASNTVEELRDTFRALPAAWKLNDDVIELAKQAQEAINRQNEEE